MGLDPISLFYCKIFGFSSAALLHYYSAADTYFYYRNAGMSIRRLFIYSCLADVVLSLFIIIPLTFISHVAPHVKG